MEDKIILTKSDFRQVFCDAFELGIREGKNPSTNTRSWEISRLAFSRYVESLPKGIRFILED